MTANAPARTASSRGKVQVEEGRERGDPSANPFFEEPDALIVLVRVRGAVGRQLPALPGNARAYAWQGWFCCSISLVRMAVMSRQNS
jgi:hypothetical protein